MQPIATYKDAIDYIHSHTNISRRRTPRYALPDQELGRMINFLDQLGNPQRDFPVILIAGTKGKGSTAAMCHRVLQQAGYKTGLYSSPHLHTFRERIRFNGGLISAEQVLALTNELYPLIERTSGVIAFEVITAIAFLTFARAEIDVAVVEVGMGGRLDATNVTEPAVSVITSISYDHTHVLGNTLSSIAREKAGIIRPAGVVISAPQRAEPMTVIEEVSAAQGASLTVVGDERPWRVGRASLNGQTLYFDGKRYELALLGRHQAVNAVTTLLAIEAFEKVTGLPVPQTARQEGLATVNWPGRLEILSQSPLVIVDSAMNGDSAGKLCQAFQEYFPGRRTILVFGASSDHDYTAMLKELLPISRQVITTQAHHPKAASPDILRAATQALGRDSSTSSTVAQALEKAMELVEERDLICITGSLFCAAEGRYAWAQRSGQPLPETD